MKFDAIYFVTRPVQYITARNVCEHLGYRAPLLLILDNFPGAQEMKANIEEFDGLWAEVKILKSRFSLPLFTFRSSIVRTHLYVDSDLYKDNLINFFASPFRKVFLIEEGFYSYIGDQSSHMRRSEKSFRLAVYKFLKLTGGLGFGWWTGGAYLYRPKAAKIDHSYQIEQDFVPYCLANLSLFLSIFMPEDVKGFGFGVNEVKQIKVYCTGPDLSVLQRNIDIGNYDIIKLHPVVDAAELVFADGEFVWPSGNMPIELLIIMLTQDFDKIYLHHENSSAGLYLQVFGGRVECINIGSYVSDYDADFLKVMNDFRGVNCR